MIAELGSLVAVFSAGLTSPSGKCEDGFLPPLHQEASLMSDWWVCSLVSQLIGGLKRRF